MTRRHDVSVQLEATPEQAFAFLITPSAIRCWWQAARVIVLARAAGTWAATWGDDEDEPDYSTSARISVFEPPRQLVLTDYEYVSKHGPLPFEAAFTTSFTVTATGAGSQVHVCQDGFPDGPEADAFFAGCAQGWHDTLAGLKRFATPS